MISRHPLPSVAPWTLAAVLISASPACDPARPPQPPAPPPPPGATEPAAPAQHIIVVSVDGLPPQSYLAPDAHGLEVPALRRLAAGGAYSPGVLSVFPSVTYPAHTSMVTGVSPALHGITRNKTFDPLARNQGGFFWYSEDIEVPTIWQLAHRAGKRTALVIWPATVGAEATFLVPEYWRAGTHDDVRLIAAMATPGLLHAVAGRFPDFWHSYTPREVKDKAPIDIAIHLIETSPPELMLVHLLMVDEYTHRHGPWSDESKARIEEADRQLGRLIAAAEGAGLWPRTTLVVISDHGFMPIRHRLRPGVILAGLGLVTLDDSGAPTDWKAAVHYEGGMAFLDVADDDDHATKKTLVDAFVALARQPDSGIARVFDRAEIRARGGDPAAFLALEAREGFAFKDDYRGDFMVPSSSKGHHGYDPERPAMKSSLVIHGPGIRPGPIAGARLIDLAPTLASWLGVTMPGVQGRVLPVRGRAAVADDR